MLHAELAQVDPVAAAGIDARNVRRVIRALEVFEKTGRPMGDLVHPVRVAVSGTGVGPGLFDMLATLGKARALARIRRTLALYGGQG